MTAEEFEQDIDGAVGARRAVLGRGSRRPAAVPAGAAVIPYQREGEVACGGEPMPAQQRRLLPGRRLHRVRRRLGRRRVPRRSATRSCTTCSATSTRTASRCGWASSTGSRSTRSCRPTAWPAPTSATRCGTAGSPWTTATSTSSGAACSPSATTRASRGSRRARTAPPSSAPQAFFHGYERSLAACDLTERAARSGRVTVAARSVAGRRIADPDDPVRTPPPAAVLFDMDGTLVDSEKLWDVALHELAARHGGTLSDAARRAMVGTDMAELDGDPARRPRPARARPGRGAAWLDARVAELFVAGLEWRPGALALLAAVRAAGIPTALVTSTAPAAGRGGPGHPRAGTASTSWSAATRWRRPSRDPEPYLTAARLLGVPIERCVAIEDSPTGVASALAAGAAVLAVPSEAPMTRPTAAPARHPGRRRPRPARPPDRRGALPDDRRGARASPERTRGASPSGPSSSTASGRTTCTTSSGT